MIETANETFGICCQYSAVLGLLSIPFVASSKPIVDALHRGRTWVKVKKVGVSALVVPALCLFGTMKDAYPTREEKDLLRGIQAEEARGRAICGGMLVGGGSLSAPQAVGLDEVGLRPGGQPDFAGFETITSTNTTRTLTAEDFERGFVMTRVGTGEEVDFTAPSNAVVCADWLEDGAAVDWIYVAMTNWMFQVGTNAVDSLRV